LYALLGDDIVIADGRVAREYLRLMETLGVGIGLHKSLISRKGKKVIEFAKRFRIPEEATPLPVKEFLAGTAMLTSVVELCRKYSASLATALSIVGHGFRVKGSLTRDWSSLSPKVRGLLLLVEFNKYPLTEWFRRKALNSLYPESN